ncbi:unnamed protein product [Macrosiphum euphorbiae]|uniref:Uncharacterized protein n=1 Tax=Macrosiphum euphorbiae TaxID=13131 RepID=A0AAV0X9P8_9HEMI|nr:unnamed protein product [Macrosiphum euphorbiae]
MAEREFEVFVVRIRTNLTSLRTVSRSENMQETIRMAFLRALQLTEQISVKKLADNHGLTAVATGHLSCIT